MVHLVLKELFDLPSEQRTEKEAKDIFLSAWAGARESKEYDGLFYGKFGEKKWGIEAMKLIENYFRLENPRKLAPTLREEKMELNFDAKGFKVVGILDRLDRTENSLNVIDYKTGKAPVLKYSLAVNERIIKEKFQQLKIYALMIKGKDGQVPNALTLMYLANPTMLTMELSEKDLKETEEDLIRVWEAVQRSLESNSFQPKTSRLCDWCSFKSNCPAFAYFS
eukprot:CAMPEP_0171457912 /NCGR_PEP_ID=MMETSP0945-20130129/3797_1 /TAXON_ID=109269 /ORGANISM="Vaucheria litorea, Strain CCMP2940" /LENGTH=222 /DNA_ID=CAMNT_0011983607 /DNA_START=298 /DNA_END=962 /DNA_ORIENTATION=-